jgi:hypothetical protein
MMWPSLSSTKPEPVAPPAWPSNSATIWTVLGNSSWATAATEPLSIGSGASERVVPSERPSSSRPEPFESQRS